MDARYLTHEQRSRLTEALAKRLRSIEDVIEHMQKSSWYTNDPIYNCLIAARASLFSAINQMHALPLEVKRNEVRNNGHNGYPRPIGKQ